MEIAFMILVSLSHPLTLMIDLLDSHFWTFGFESIYTWTLLVPVAVGIYTFNRHDSIQHKLLLLVITSFLFEYFAQLKWALQQFDPKTNAPYYHFFTPVLFALYVSIYQKYLRDIFKRRVDFLLVPAFIVFAFWNAIYGDGIYSFPGKSLGTYAFLMMVIAILYFLRLMTTLELERLEKEPAFWVSAGVLIYFSGNFLLWLTMNYLLEDKSLSYSIYQIGTILGFLLNVLFTIAFVCRPKAVLPKPTHNQKPNGI